MTDTPNALIMHLRCARSRPVFMQMKPIVSSTVAVPLSSALTVGSASVNDINQMFGVS